MQSWRLFCRQNWRALTLGVVVALLFLVGILRVPFFTKNNVTHQEWKAQLDPVVYHIIAERGTEPPFSSPLNDEKRPGTYVAADTGEPIFRSEQKFDSGTGWPSFTAPISPDAIRLVDDYSFLGRRTEVLSTAGGHLGHVFDDGPAPTGKRYCINGLALRFIPDEPTP